MVESFLGVDARRELLENILPFWRLRTVDYRQGGFIAEMSNDLRLKEDAPKGLILNARILWTFSAAYAYGREADDAALARRAYEFMTRHFLDTRHGGYFWTLDPAGDVRDDSKRIYGQAFCIYALAEYSRAFDDPKALQQAIDLFCLIEANARDIRYGGYIEACSRDWQPREDMRLSDKDMNEKKSMNNHLHLLEAYTGLLRAWPDLLLADRLRELIDIFRRHILNTDGTHFQHFFDEAWNPRSDTYTFGHDIEGSWLLTEAAEVLGDGRLSEQVRDTAVKIARAVLREGLDSDGGLLYEAKAGRIINPAKEWWPQAEAVVGFYNAWQLTGEATFRDAADRCWQYIQDHLVDRAHGEWFWRVLPDGNPDISMPKVSMWKCPYHNGRCCMEIIRRSQAQLQPKEQNAGGGRFNERLQQLLARHQSLVDRPNQHSPESNGVFERYIYPVLTADHTPIWWRYDLDEQTNPHLMERMGINSVFNPGAIEHDGKILLMARVEGADRKSFFAVAESETGIDRFRFWDYPVVMPETADPDINVYDMRLVKHQDGWIYGLFCTERKDPQAPRGDLSSAVAQCGIARTKDLKTWQRLPDLKTRSPQQRNVVLHPEFVNGKYAFYTRPQDGFIDTGSGGGIGWALADDIEHAVIGDERIVHDRKYHTIYESKNGLGPAPIKTPDGWLQLAHGVRGTAAGLRYVLYAFMTALDDPSRLIHEPGGYLLAPCAEERVGDVSNVTFSCGWVARTDGQVFIYYASSDTRCHVATSSVERLVDYCKNTPPDPLRSYACVQQRIALIRKNLEQMRGND